jgi:succinate dehydrogenase/fumarate reductase flavoprotein subunit
VNCKADLSRSRSFRLDFFNHKQAHSCFDNVNWLCHTELVKEDGTMKLSKLPIALTKFKPADFTAKTSARATEPVPV